jgi:hypothetical protein
MITATRGRAATDAECVTLNRPGSWRHARAHTSSTQTAARWRLILGRGAADANVVAVWVDHDELSQPRGTIFTRSKACKAALLDLLPKTPRRQGHAGTLGPTLGCLDW